MILQLFVFFTAGCVFIVDCNFYRKIWSCCRFGIDCWSNFGTFLKGLGRLGAILGTSLGLLRSQCGRFFTTDCEVIDQRVPHRIYDSWLSKPILQTLCFHRFATDFWSNFGTVLEGVGTLGAILGPLWSQCSSLLQNGGRRFAKLMSPLQNGIRRFAKLMLGWLVMLKMIKMLKIQGPNLKS